MTSNSNEAQLAGLKKKVNAASWNTNIEYLMKSWGEKPADLRFMHANPSGGWKKFGDIMTLGITTVVSGVSLVANEAKNILLYGGVGIFSSLLKKFYNADQTSVASQFGSFYSYVKLQMALKRDDRLPSDTLTEDDLKVFKSIPHDTIDVCEDSLDICEDSSSADVVEVGGDIKG